MSDTQGLLSKIAALRQRLERPSTTSAVATMAAPTVPTRPAERLTQLEADVDRGAQHSRLLDYSLRQINEADGTVEAERVWPQRLTLRSRQLLERGRELVARLRPLCDEPLLGRDDTDPLAAKFRQTVAMADVALRTIQTFPDAPSVQLRLCEGLEGVFDDVASRLESILAAVQQRKRDTDWVGRLADLLHVLTTEERMDIKPFLFLAEEILAEAREGAPLRFLAAGTDQPESFVAAHSLVVAQVIARIVAHDSELRGRPLEAILAGLLHDAGMLRVPGDILSHPGPLDDDQRRVVESHTRHGGDMMQRLWPAAAWLSDAALGHHERIDGTGYPDGLRDAQIPALNRLLAVCDVYAALCVSRPYRAGQETRTALTDTLLLAEQGSLDRTQAERLLTLSFYPVGSVVELVDGSLALVVATPQGRRDLNHPARPVLLLLTDAHGRRLPAPRHLDLGQVEGHGIVRALPAADRRRLLGRIYPEAA